MTLRRPLRTLAALATVGLTTAAGSSAHAAAAPRGTAPPLASVTGLDAAGRQRLSALHWRSFRASAGAATIRVSPAYGDSNGIASRWSAYFDSLVHGSELAALNAYVAPLAEVQQICGGADVLGCYGDNHLVIPDQLAGPVAATSVATHEYGHHVANNRVNAPWRAIDWGTKRWATAEHVCERVAARTAFPGDEGDAYMLNPGEAFAESYRLLNETSAGLPLTWPIVDPSFLPDAAALQALREDVLNPWTGATVTTRRITLSRAARTWTMRVDTPLDGLVHVQVKPGSDDVALLAPDTRALLAQGSWTSSGSKAADFTVCGRRSVVLRVTRHSAARRFTLQLSAP